MHKGLLFLLFLSLLGPSTLEARDFEAETKVVLQVNERDPKLFKRVLTNAVNLIKHYGMDDVQVEISTYAGGVYLLEEKGPEAQRIRALMMQNVEFSACGFTMSSLKKAGKKPPKLIKGVEVVRFGLPHIVELQKKGYTYIRP